MGQDQRSAWDLLAGCSMLQRLMPGAQAHTCTRPCCLAHLLHLHVPPQLCLGKRGQGPLLPAPWRKAGVRALACIGMAVTCPG